MLKIKTLSADSAYSPRSQEWEKSQPWTTLCPDKGIKGSAEIGLGFSGDSRRLGPTKLGDPSQVFTVTIPKQSCLFPPWLTHMALNKQTLTHLPLGHVNTAPTEPAKSKMLKQASILGPRGSVWVEFSEWDQRKGATYLGSYGPRTLTLGEPSESFYFSPLLM